MESTGGGGGGWIRTNVGARQRIYSPPPLATRAPLRTGKRGLKPNPCPCQRGRLATPIFPAGGWFRGLSCAWLLPDQGAAIGALARVLARPDTPGHDVKRSRPAAIGGAARDDLNGWTRDDTRTGALDPTGVFLAPLVLIKAAPGRRSSTPNRKFTFG
jgi:hypothetical protein